MKSNRALLISTAVILIAIFGLSAYVYQSQEKKEEKTETRVSVEKLVPSYSPTRGPANAPVTIVEFMDPECEACRAVHPMVKQVLEDFPRKVRLVVRYRLFHKNSLYAASVLEAVRQKGKYWELLDTIFKNQPQWASHSDPKPELIMTYVKEIGLNPEEVKESLKDFIYEDRVRRDEDAGKQLGVTGTPTFFVNGQRVQELSYQSLKRAVASALN